MSKPESTGVIDTEETQAPAAAATPGFVDREVIKASWKIRLDDLQRNLAHNPADVVETFVACFRWCISDDHPIKLQEFAQAVNVDYSTLWKQIHGTYVHPESGARLLVSEKQVDKMQHFLRLESERASAKRIGFVRTPTAQKIFNACELARESQSPVFLIGPSHIGKTWALKEYTEKHNHGRTIYCRLKAASGLGGMIKAIYSALGNSDRSNTAAMTERIKRGLKPNMLLVLDEVHQLMYTYRKESFFACLEVLREIYDETGCGMVFCGTALLFKRVKDNRGELEQFFRRGVHKIILPDQPLRGDVEAVALAAGVEMPTRNASLSVIVGGRTLTEQPYEMLRQVGRDEGLKAITERLRYGQKLANKAKTKLTWEHVVKAHFIIRQAAEPANDWE